ncbi:putative succinyl-diaminopimelate desuccinylase [subsurface metagenome]
MKISKPLKDEIILILKNLVQLHTENPPGITESVVKFLILDVFKEEHGFQNQVVINRKNGVELHNLISTIGHGKEKIVLSGHFDVVPTGDPAQWKYHPFSAEIKNGKLYGRGSADMKGGIASLIGVIKILSKIPRFLEKYKLVFVGTADEEIGMMGSLSLSKQGVMNNSILLIIAEPTNLKIGIAEKGLLWVKLKIIGKYAHGSMPHEGINAIEGAIKIIPQLYNCLEEKRNVVLGKSTLNIGKISGGTAINIVPDQAVLDIDYRLIPEQDHNTLINNLNNLQLIKFPINIEILKELPALQTDSNHLFIQNLKGVSKSELLGLSYATDAAHLISVNSPIPFVIFGPGDPNNIHKIDEFIELEQVFQATEFLTNALLQTYNKEKDK